MILLFYRCKSISAMLDSGYNGVKMMLSKPANSTLSPSKSATFPHNVSA